MLEKPLMTKFGKKHQKFQEMHLTDENAEKVLNRSQSWQAVSKQINKYENEPAKGSISQDIFSVGRCYKAVILPEKILKMPIFPAAICKKLT